MAEAHLEDLVEQLSNHGLPISLLGAIAEVAQQYRNLNTLKAMGGSETEMRYASKWVRRAFSKLVEVTQELGRDLDAEYIGPEDTCSTCHQRADVMCSESPISSHPHHETEKGHCPGRVGPGEPR